MACELSQIQSDACTSGIGRQQDKVKLLQWIAQLSCEISQGLILSEQFTLQESVAFSGTVTHGFGAVPSFVRVVMVCLVNDADSGIVAGQELDIASVYNSPLVGMQFSVYADSTTIKVFGLAAAGSDLTVVNFGVQKVFTSLNQFAIKVYYSR